MATYWYKLQNGQRATFTIDATRVDEIRFGLNMSTHYNNGSVHGGMGNGVAPPIGGVGLAMHQSGEVVTQLPTTATYTEYVWNRGGAPAGISRIIKGSDGSLWVTLDHYDTYHRLHEEADVVHRSTVHDIEKPSATGMGKHIFFK